MFGMQENLFEYVCDVVYESINDVWGAIWIVLVSEIWKHRNNVIFKGGEVDVLKLFTLVQLKVWSWVTSKVPSVVFSYSDSCIDPLVCIEVD